MTDIDEALPRAFTRWRRPRLTLVVIADHERQVTRLSIDRSSWAPARLITLVGRTPAEVHEELSQLRVVHLVLDVRSATGPAQLDTLELSAFHLARRGAWVALRSVIPARGDEPLVQLATQLQGPQPRRVVASSWRPYVRSLAVVHITRTMVVLRKKKPHMLSLRHDQVPALLRSREPDLQVTEIARLPGGVVDTTGRRFDYGVEPRVRVPDVLPYPEHVVRRYDGTVHLPRGPIAYHGRTLLPETFRRHLGAELDSPGLFTVGHHFGRLRDPTPPTERLEGSYFHFLYANPGHFGHLMTEAFAKLWGWLPAKEADPSLKMLCRRKVGTTGPGLEQTLLPAFGVDPDDIVWIDGGVTVDSLVGCTPMWHNWTPYYANPAILETWARLRTGLIGTGPVEAEPRIFVTRRRHNRLCRNFAKVERFFENHGFVVVAPEEHSIPDQVRMFAGARVIAGFAGASMFNLNYADAVETVIVLSQSAYHARNEHLYAAVHGAELHSFWSTPNIDHPPDGLSYRAHQSRWKFDFATNAGPLAELLDGLVQ
jgi:capsular polysaccharide biosynthesis protein